ncbi:MAG: endopeptidase [Stenotrophomonas sp.]|uniref:endopeptidase n=1 Tax=Stenotrophomonas sp. TaxID=69392 RepID=UPI003D6D3078
MIRVLATALLLLLGIIVWQRGSVLKSEASASAATADRNAATAALSAAEAEIGQLGTVLKTERASVKAANALAARYEEEKKDAQAESDRLVADLRAGNRQLHQRWQAAIHTTVLSQPVATASQSDGGVDERIQSAGRIIAAVDQCDAQVRALQAYARQVGGAP